VNEARQEITWAEVDLKAIAANVRYVRSKTDAQVMAVVKANGYGHGAVPVARAAAEGGATWFAVARDSEAVDLRRAGFDQPILLFGPAAPDRLESLVSAGVSLTVWGFEQAEAASRAAEIAGRAGRLHLNVDTGMGRLGVQPSEAVELAKRILQLNDIVLEGVYTHFARADEADQDPTEAQSRLFRQVLADFDQQGLARPLIHVANSAATLQRPSDHFDLVRLGIAMYGLAPSDACPLPAQFRPALTWMSRLSQVKLLPPGRGVSYGHQYVTRGHERIGTVPVGYADGFRRVDGNEVLVGGVRVPVVGRVCMDQCLVQLDAVPEASEGDQVVIIGAQADQEITAEEIAGRWGTINYEVVCGIGPRVPRYYIPS
jgi:alanine racemase